MALVTSEAQKIIQDATIELVQINHSSAGVHRFSNGSRDPLVSVSYNSNEYFARQFDMSSSKVRGSGALPRPTLRLDNVDRYFWPLVQDHDQLLGATVTYLSVYRQHLDDGLNPDGNAFVARSEYIIRQVASLSAYQINLKLATPLDAEQALFGRVALRRVCPRTYRIPTETTNQFIDVTDLDSKVTCPYTGTNYFKRDGSSTSDYNEDSCGNTLNDCEKRFGSDNYLPFKGFPSIGNPNA